MSRVARLVQSLGRLSLRPPVTIATPCHHVTQTKGLCSFAQLSQMSTHPVSSLTTPKFPHNCKLLQPTPVNTYQQTANMASLRQMHKQGPPKKAFFNRKTTMNGCAQRKGVVLKVLIKKPKKPNSANRKCVRVKLSTGRQIVAYIPGEGHNLQEHNIVLVRGGKKQDLPGVKHRVVRGKYDCSHVVKKTA